MASAEQSRVSVTQNTDPSSCTGNVRANVTILATVQPDWGFKLELQTKVKRRLVSIVSYSRPSHMISLPISHLLSVGSMSIKCLNDVLNVKALVGTFN